MTIQIESIPCIDKVIAFPTAELRGYLKELNKLKFSVSSDSFP